MQALILLILIYFYNYYHLFLPKGVVFDKSYVTIDI